MRRGALAAAIVVTFAWASNATVRSLVHEANTLDTDGPALARIGRRCLDRPHSFVVSTDPGVEFALNGRIHTHDLELWNESRLGRFPETVWAADMRNSAVRCVVTWTGDSPLPPHPAGIYPPAVADVVRERFLPPDVDGPYAIYPARDP